MSHDEQTPGERLDQNERHVLLTLSIYLLWFYQFEFNVIAAT
jgi:hypothetical protein